MTQRESSEFVYILRYFAVVGLTLGPINPIMVEFLREALSRRCRKIPGSNYRRKRQPAKSGFVWDVQKVKTENGEPLR